MKTVDLFQWKGFVGSIVLGLAFSVISGPGSVIHAVEAHPHHGLYAIWYSGQPEVLDLPYIVGGQVVRQWADLAPAPGQFDFSPLDEELSRLHARGYPATIQINGNQKPAWSFSRVPYHPEHISHQVGDAPGTLMYWHPAHRQAYHALL
ncbi:MAG: beta-galactosidase, partial [Verrucomicrobiae bacterium]|nr:beta-galactosidase [Verrucomicrobiae bacterium]